jgi:LPS export ABC transporter protein LptC
VRTPARGLKNRLYRVLPYLVYLLQMKRVLKKHWPLVGICILFVVVTYYLFRAYYGVVKKPVFSGVISEGDSVKLQNVSYDQSDADEGVKWHLNAEEIAFSKDRQRISFRKFHLKVEFESRPPAEIEGQRGHYDKRTGEMNLYGDLQGRTEDGYRIYTEHILYRQKEGYLESQEPVRIIGPTFSLAGRGLYFHPQKEIMKISSGVTTTVQTDSFI